MPAGASPVNDEAQRKKKNEVRNNECDNDLDKREINPNTCNNTTEVVGHFTIIINYYHR